MDPALQFDQGSSLTSHDISVCWYRALSVVWSCGGSGFANKTCPGHANSVKKLTSLKKNLESCLSSPKLWLVLFPRGTTISDGPGKHYIGGLVLIALILFTPRKTANKTAHLYKESI